MCYGYNQFCYRTGSHPLRFSFTFTSSFRLAPVFRVMPCAHRPCGQSPVRQRRRFAFAPPCRVAFDVSRTSRAVSQLCGSPAAAPSVAWIPKVLPAIMRSIHRLPAGRVLLLAVALMSTVAVAVRLHSASTHAEVGRRRSTAVHRGAQRSRLTHPEMLRKQVAIRALEASWRRGGPARLLASARMESFVEQWEMECFAVWCTLVRTAFSCSDTSPITS